MVQTSGNRNTEYFRQTAETLGVAKAIYDPKKTKKFDIHGDSQEAQLARRSGHFQDDESKAQGEDVDDQKAKEKKLAEEARVMSDTFEDVSETIEASAGADWYGDWNGAEHFISDTFDQITETAEAGAAAVYKAGEDALEVVDKTISDGYHATVKAGGEAIDYAGGVISDKYNSAKSWLLGPDTASTATASADATTLEGEKGNVVSAKKLKMSFDEASNPPMANNDDTPQPAQAPVQRIPTATYAAPVVGGMG